MAVPQGARRFPQRFWSMLMWENRTGAADLLAMHSWCECPITTHHKGALRVLECNGMFTTLRWFELYDMVPYPNGAATWRCLHSRHKEINMVRMNRHQWAVAFKRSPGGTKGPKVCREYIRHTITPLEARLTHSFILFIPNSVARFWRAMQCATFLESVDDW